MKVKICPNCGKEFVETSQPKTCCKNSCASKWWRTNKAKEKKEEKSVEYLDCDSKEYYEMFYIYK